METLGSAFWGGAVFALAIYFAGRAVLQKMQAGKEQLQAGAEFSDPALRSLYVTATRLADFSKVAAHPGELLKHQLFEEGVTELLSGKFSEDDLFGYAAGENDMLACMAIEAISRKMEPENYGPRVLRLLGHAAAWPAHFIFRHVAQGAPGEMSVIGIAMVEASDQLWEDQIKTRLLEFIEKRIAAGEKPAFGAALARLDTDNTYNIEHFLKSVTAFDPTAMQNELAEHIRQAATTAGQNDDTLNSVGQIWSSAQTAQADQLITHSALDLHVRSLASSLKAKPPKSTLVVGASGVGKSAVLNRLARLLQKDKWTIFVAGHTELVAGQSYIGEFEGQLRRVIEELKARKKVLWIIPGLEALALSGTHRFSAVSALDMLLPYMETGEIRVAAEMSAAAYESLSLAKPRISSCITVERINALSANDTLEVGRQWLQQRAAKTEKGIIDEAWHLAQHFLGEVAAPGNLLKLLQLTEQRLLRGRGTQKTGSLTITREDLFTTLIELTGLSAAMLDEAQSLNIDALRDHFHHRVIGQDEAVDCLVERIAMIKAGVTDPTRPAGVFLFAGPTGTGKTEIAKTLAEWLFGSPQRMIRIDMSELQSANSLERLVGTELAGSSALTDKIREQPFSVVLLDEFEKAHPAIWDFFLQVFDDGRLTDAQGRTADFRHAIIILTSNLGAAVPTDAPMGFAGAQAGFDPSSVSGEIEKVFRREFINRIDRVVIFRPLSRDIMRDILQKELDLAFQRRGLRARSWAVEWDEAAINFLLEKGFTPDLGARPLKRAVDRHLLAPLAQTIVRGQVPEGDQFLFVTERSGNLQVEFVDPNATQTPATKSSPPTRSEKSKSSDLTLRGLILNAEGKAAETRILAGCHADLATKVGSAAWDEEKAANLSLMQLPEFWKSPERFGILGKVECIDRIEAATRRAGSLLRRISGSGKQKNGPAPRDMVQSLAQTLYLLEIALHDLEKDLPLEAFLRVDAGRNAAGSGDAVSFAMRIADMYVAWAKQRRMTYKIIESKRPPSSKGFAFTMAVSGFGAHSILRDEAGLHVFETEAANSRKNQRSTVRVSVAAQPAEPPATGQSSLVKHAAAVFAALPAGKRNIVRHYRETPSPLVRDTQKGWRTGRIDRVLEGNFDLVE